jgi:hypothetical protein
MLILIPFYAKLKKLSLTALEKEVPVLREIDQKKLFGGYLPNTTVFGGETPIYTCVLDCLNYLDDYFGGNQTSTTFTTAAVQSYGMAAITNGLTPSQAEEMAHNYFETVNDVPRDQWQNFVAGERCDYGGY